MGVSLVATKFSRTVSGSGSHSVSGAGPINCKLTYAIAAAFGICSLSDSALLAFVLPCPRFSSFNWRLYCDHSIAKSIRFKYQGAPSMELSSTFTGTGRTTDRASFIPLSVCGSLRIAHARCALRTVFAAEPCPFCCTRKSSRSSLKLNNTSISCCSLFCRWSRRQ